MNYLDTVMLDFSQFDEVKGVEKTDFGLAVKLQEEIGHEREKDLLAKIRVPVLPSDGQYYIGMDFKETPFSIEFLYPKPLLMSVQKQGNLPPQP